MKCSLDELLTEKQNAIEIGNIEKYRECNEIISTICNKTIIDQVVINKYNNYKEAMEDLNQQGVVHLGWLNDGIKIPEHLKCQEVYSSPSGISCLYCDTIYRISYSVDMGD